MQNTSTLLHMLHIFYEDYTTILDTAIDSHF